MSGVKIAKYSPHPGLKTKDVHRLHIEVCPTLEAIVRDTLGGEYFNVMLNDTGINLIGDTKGRFHFSLRKESKQSTEALVLALVDTQVQGLIHIPAQALDVSEPKLRSGIIHIPWIPEDIRRAPKQMHRGQGGVKVKRQAELPLKQPKKPVQKARTFTEDDIRNLSAALNEAIKSARDNGQHIKVSQAMSGDPIGVTSVTNYV